MLRKIREDVLQAEHLKEHRQNYDGLTDQFDKDADECLESGACQRDRLFVSQR